MCYHKRYLHIYIGTLDDGIGSIDDLLEFLFGSLSKNEDDANAIEDLNFQI